MKESKKHKDTMILVVCVCGGERERESGGGGLGSFPWRMIIRKTPS